ncbi:LOW QUALITY PROTEIN: hypothetical protein V1478_005387 [Vespula squamosa]|uniref:Secreted protein n=1 Tax=Vespula squamosa TaxID=30214 RepID=A0ABD2BDZ7_VESSQ
MFEFLLSSVLFVFIQEILWAVKARTSFIILIIENLFCDNSYLSSINLKIIDCITIKCHEYIVNVLVKMMTILVQSLNKENDSYK